MSDVSNRTVAALLFVAMAVTVFSTAVTLNKLNVIDGGGLTGFATNPNATATLNISASTSIKFNVATIDWSNGTVNTSGGNLQCNLSSTGYPAEGSYPYPGCIGFIVTPPADFVLENDGNQNASITLELDEASDTWIGGNNALSDTYADLANNEVGSCDDIQNAGTALTTGAQTFCGDLQYQDANDLVDIRLKVSVPSDAPTGVKTATIIATATPV